MTLPGGRSTGRCVAGRFCFSSFPHSRPAICYDLASFNARLERPLVMKVLPQDSAATIERAAASDAPFRLEEATIDDLHAAIRAGRTTCVDVVKQYIARARAYNGVASRLVTADGAPVAPVTGAVRAQAPLAFPTETVKASAVLPDLDKYKGTPLEYGRMEPTASDPEMQQQFGM